MRFGGPLLAIALMSIGWLFGFVVGKRDTDHEAGVQTRTITRVESRPLFTPLVITLPAPERPRGPELSELCLAGHLAGNDSPATDGCPWHTGFPAVAADGKRIAIANADYDSASGGLLGMNIQLLDVKTSKVVKQLPLVTTEEVVASNNFDQLEALVRKRIYDAQLFLNANGYGAMVSLVGGNDVETGGRVVRAEIAGDGGGATESQVRIVDKERGAVWSLQHAVAPDAYDMRGAGMSVYGVWYHPHTNTALVGFNISDGHGYGESEYRAGKTR
jgi:hypothetical protein